MSLGDWILTGMAIAGCIPVTVLFLETFVAVLPQRRRIVSASRSRPNCAVLIPAHNEEAGIEATILALRSQLQHGDRVIVIADNCQDRTAAIARTLGVIVLERSDSSRRGKGFALEHGMNALVGDPPDIVVILDADARLAVGAFDHLVQDGAKFHCPVQAIYFETLVNSGTRERWSAFAMLFKNWVRPLGLYRMGLPCLLTGSGMAFPWKILRTTVLGTANIVEDMKLGLDLAIQGFPPRLCPDAKVTAESAPHLQAVRSQRTRWEHGHINTLLTQTPRLLLAGLMRARPKLIGLALELSVPPLSLLAMLLGLSTLLSLFNWCTGGSYLPFLTLMTEVTVLIMTIFTGWLRFGQSILPLNHLLMLPIYILWKIPIYLKLLVAPQKTWNRTERTEST